MAPSVFSAEVPCVAMNRPLLYNGRILWNTTEMSISREILLRISTRVNECLRIARENWPYHRFEYPDIVYNLSGRTAGYAFYHKNCIRLNHQMLNTPSLVDKMINEIVGHEIAHLVSYQVYGKDGRGHGPLWKSVMVLFGQAPNRCYSYDISEIDLKNGMLTCKCDACGYAHRVSPAKAARIQGYMGTRFAYYHKCGPNRRGFVSIVETESLPVLPRAALQYTSKLEHCKVIRANSSHLTRAALIAAFVEQAGCTKAGAATYYQLLNKSA